jgi:hypothetical protein
LSGAFPLAVACSSTSPGSGSSGSSSGAGGASASSSSGTTSSGTGTEADASQTPPQGETNVKAWLAAGYYKSWACQPAEHPSRPPSPHSFNRICSNDLIASGSPPWPVGAAAVKELYNGAADAGGEIFGYAVYLKTADDADGGNGGSWYWYEDDPPFNPDGGIVADGLGTMGAPMAICVSCHIAAGSNAAHAGPGDFVYTQVP